MTDMEVWKPHRLEVGQYLRARIGPLRIWLRRRGDEIHIATQRNEDAESFAGAGEIRIVEESEAVGLDWGRWVCGDQCGRIVLTPVMPDRPVVVRPELPVKIPSGGEALFFVGIPLWIRITAANGKEFKLCEEPSIDLSNIWFGDPMSGSLCYSLRTRARRDIADTQVKSHRALCPVTIKNASPELANVERFCVHVAHLSVYGGTRRLLTDAVRITFRGNDEVSQVEYLAGPPAYEGVGDVLSSPRTPVRTTLLKKSLAGFGLFGGA